MSLVDDMMGKNSFDETMDGVYGCKLNRGSWWSVQLVLERS